MNKHVTYTWQQYWHFCEQDCPHCWRPCSYRILHQPVWRPVESTWAPWLGRWEEAVRDNVSTSHWVGGNLQSPHRWWAHPVPGPLPLCRLLTAESLGVLWRGDDTKSQNTYFLWSPRNKNTCFLLQNFTTCGNFLWWGFTDLMCAYNVNTSDACSVKTVFDIQLSSHNYHTLLSMYLPHYKIKLNHFLPY